MSALERRIDADLELGVEGGLIAELEALIVEHPLRERLRGQLILALYRDGRQAEALEVYRETRRVLADELGLEPSPALRDLERAILRQDPALAAAAPRPPRSEVLAPPGVVLVLASGLGLAAWIASSGVAPEPAAAPARRASVPSTGTTNVARPAAVTVTRPPLTNTAKPTTRPRLRRAATVASARPRPVASRPVPAATTRAPRPVEALRIGDDFADAAIDSTIWNVTDHSAAFLHREGRLEITVPPDAVPDRDWSQVGGHYGTRCSFRGPFDARVDYELLEWLRGNGVYAGLVAYFANAGITRNSHPQSGDKYGSFVSSVHGGLATADARGRLRMRRVDGVITTYFWHDGGWRLLVSGRSTGTATLGVQAQASGDEFARMQVRVAFDNFVVTAPLADCPPGSDPRDD